MIIHKDKIIFKSAYLNTEEGRISQTDNDRFKKLKKDIGVRRFIAGSIRY